MSGSRAPAMALRTLVVTVALLLGAAGCTALLTGEVIQCRVDADCGGPELDGLVCDPTHGVCVDRRPDAALGP